MTGAAKSVVRVAIGIVCLCAGGLGLVMTVKDMVQTLLGGYLGSVAVGHVLFDGAVTAIFLVPGSMLLRQHLLARKGQVMFWVGVAATWGVVAAFL